eukprot:scaffold12195_cov164-Isochrysis_galbana.AAC.4
MCTGTARSSIAGRPRYMAPSLHSSASPPTIPSGRPPVAATCARDLAASTGKVTSCALQPESTPASIRLPMEWADTPLT